jgi:hypothetical protein
MENSESNVDLLKDKKGCLKPVNLFFGTPPMVDRISLEALISA